MRNVETFDDRRIACRACSVAPFNIHHFTLQLSGLESGPATNSSGLHHSDDSAAVAEQVNLRRSGFPSITNRRSASFPSLDRSRPYPESRSSLAAAEVEAIIASIGLIPKATIRSSSWALSP